MNEVPVLIVEDEPDLQWMISQMLIQEGYRTVATTSAAEGKRLARTLRPTLILLNFTLPDGTGLDVLKELAGDGLLTDTKVIMLASAEQATEELLCLQAGARAWLVKGNLARIRSTIQGVLQAS